MFKMSLIGFVNTFVQCAFECGITPCISFQLKKYIYLKIVISKAITLFLFRVRGGYACFLADKGESIYVKDLVPEADTIAFIQNGFFQAKCMFAIELIVLK